MASKKNKKTITKPAKKAAKVPVKKSTKSKKIVVRRVDDNTTEPKMGMETSTVQGVTTIDGMVVVDPNKEIVN